MKRGELTWLKMDTNEIEKLVDEFLKRDIRLTFDRYKAIQEEYFMITKQIKDGEIGSQEGIAKKELLIKESEEAEIRFDNEKDFLLFSMALAQRFHNDLLFIRISNDTGHEIQHSLPYKQAGISSYFGWHKFKQEGELTPFAAFHKAFGERYDGLSDDEKNLLKYESLKAVSQPSTGDLKDIQRLEELHGKGFFAQQSKDFTQERD